MIIIEGYESKKDDSEEWLLMTLEERQRTIDPVKHGRWIDMGDNSAPICSECKSKALLNYESDYHKSDYCPHCGAKMDEGEEDEL